MTWNTRRPTFTEPVTDCRLVLEADHGGCFATVAVTLANRPARAGRV